MVRSFSIYVGKMDGGFKGVGCIGSESQGRTRKGWCTLFDPRLTFTAFLRMQRMGVAFEKKLFGAFKRRMASGEHCLNMRVKVDTRADWTLESIVVIFRKKLILISVRTDRCVAWTTYPVRQDSLHFLVWRKVRQGLEDMVEEMEIWHQAI